MNNCITLLYKYLFGNVVTYVKDPIAPQKTVVGIYNCIEKNKIVCTISQSPISWKIFNYWGPIEALVMLIKVAGTCPGLELLYCKDKEVRLMSQERERQDRGTTPPPHPFSTTFSMRDIPERVVAISFFQTEYMYCLNLTNKDDKKVCHFLEKDSAPKRTSPPCLSYVSLFFLKGILW